MNSATDVANAIRATVEASGAFDAVYLNTPWNKLSVEELEALPIGELAKDNSTLFLWCDTYTAGSAAELLKKWGFRFHSVGGILNLAEEAPKPAPSSRSKKAKPAAEPAAGDGQPEETEAAT